MNNLLIVEDNKDMQFLLSQVFSDKNFKVFSTDKGSTILDIIKSNVIDIVLLDIQLPDANGINLLEKVKQFDREIIVIMMTAFGDMKSAIDAIKLGAYDYITKPFNNEELLITIRKAIENRELKREVKSLKHKLKENPEIELGTSDAIKNVIKQVDLIAPTNMSVIIQGDSGTGKEVYANLIHKRSLRKKYPFVAVDCGAIPENLLESELFGYEKGAFTGANRKKKGKFEEANNGTLLLDEITNLPFDGQAKLLRVIQEKKVQRVGGKEPINVNIRILATTNVDIYEYVREGKFRDDLFHRLNEFKLELPALKNRQEDIPFLAQQFLEEANIELKKNIKDFSHDAMVTMLNYSWPGNVRELKHVIKRAVLLSSGYEIEKENLYLVDNSKIKQVVVNKDNSGNNQQSLTDVKKNIEKEYIKSALEETKGNKSEAARKLNMHRKTLYRKMRKFNLD